MCELLRAELQRVPAVAVVAATSRVPDILRLIEARSVDAVVCQLCTGQEAVARLLRAARQGSSKIAILAVPGTEAEWLRAKTAFGTTVRLVRLEEGFAGLLEVLAKALPSRHAKSSLLEAAARWRTDQGEVTVGRHLLTARQRQVLELLARGWTTGAIARKLGLSPRTVDSHRVNLLKRLNVTTTAEAVRKAMLSGLIR